MNFKPIEHEISAANCPICGAYAKFTWYDCCFKFKGSQNQYIENSLEFGKCTHCNEFTIWHDQRYNHPVYSGVKYTMIYPYSGSTPLPNSDLPEDIQIDYNEAASIVELSPRGAVALLRLAVQKLCKHLGEKGENINQDIKSLVSKGLNPLIQQALDSVRVTGNSAVHPGSLDLRDDRETALKIFGFINVIANTMITQPKEIQEFYELKVPEGDKAAIARRDNI